MRRSSRLETAGASGNGGKRISALIAQHAQRVRQGSEDSEEDEAWVPQPGAIESPEEAEEGELSDSASSEEEMARRRVRPRTAKRKAPQVLDSESDSDSNSEDKKKTMAVRAKAKQKKARPTPLAAKPSRSVAVARAATVKSETKRVGGDPPQLPKEEPADAHRRPMKQQMRGKAPQTSGGEDRKPAPPGSKSQLGPPPATSTTSTNTLNHLFEQILEWKFYDALRREAQKDFTFSDANDGSEEGEVEVAKVPSKFDSYDHYFSVWGPLALEEVQAQTINSVTTDQPNPIPVTTKGFGTTFISKTCKIRVDPNKQNGPPPTKRNGGREPLNDLFVNDLVLITTDRRYFQKALASGKTSHRHGKTEARSGDSSSDLDLPLNLLAIVTSQRASREGLTMITSRTAWSALSKDKDKDQYLFKLNNLVTSVREFRALCDCREYQLMPLLLSGKHAQGSMRLDSLGLKYVQWLKRSFNESQQEAIAAAATSEGFTLIKGPPGTGKTTTLKGLLNSLHLREYSRYYNAVLDVARRPDSETAKAWAAVGNEKPHILVTAPSNAAVDNIVGKVMEEGFCDGEGRQYFPKIVRVGRGLSTNVRSVGLDDMVDEVCRQPLDVLEGHIARLRQELFVVEHDSLRLRDQLRQIVMWIEHDPVGALAAQVQAQAEAKPQAQTQEPPPPATPSETPPSPPPPPPPLDLPPPSTAEPPQSSSENSSVLALSTEAYPVSPPPPPSPPGPASPTGAPSPSSDAVAQMSSSDQDLSQANESGGEFSEQEEDEDEDEDFPTSFGAPPPAWDEQTEIFNAEESGKALNAFLDDGSNSEEDEPLPISTGPTASDEAGSSAQHPVNIDDDDETEEDEKLPNQPMQVDNGDNLPEKDEPFPGQSTSFNVDDQSQPPMQPERQQAEEGVTSPLSPPQPPSSTPPPPPPLSPPPPPPLSPPPPPSDGEIEEHRPSSPNVMPMSPRPPPITPPGDKQEATTGWKSIDYSQYHPYVGIAQQINLCLEKLSEVKLELKRYEFAREAVSQMGGKRSQATRQSLEVSFLDTAHIVFTTLSSAGVAALDASNRYDVLVVDEAAQAVELSTIIPMKFGSRQCVLVGDPQQLSATVFSRNSGVSLYERSLFERLESCEHPVHMLRTQYRSHPMISDFPRHYFYAGKLQDGENVLGESYVKPYHSLGPAFMPLVFWNLLSSREKATKSVSRMNVGEAELAVNLYLTLKNSCPPDAIAGKVGMITPYSQQMEELKKRFRQKLGDCFDQEVEINTVDGFQGREKDIIILSTVRADPKAGIGFLNDTRRMNVALTRAKFACYVIGSENTLRSSKPWNALLDHSYNHHCIVHVENPTCNLLTLQPMVQPVAPARSHAPPSQINAHHRPQQAPPFQGGQQFPGAQPPLRTQKAVGSGYRSRGRGGDGGRSGRFSGYQRGGRSNRGRGRGRGRGASNQQFAPRPQFAPGPQYASQAPRGYAHPPSMPMAMQNGGRVPVHAGRVLDRGQPTPEVFGARGPGPAFIPPSLPPTVGAPPIMGAPSGAFPRPLQGPGRGNGRPRDPRQRGGQGGRGGASPSFGG